VEQGLLGLVLWIAFAFRCLARNPLELRRLGGVADVGFWAVCVFSWTSGMIGTGFLAAVPGTMILMLYMGMIASTPKVSTARQPQYFEHGPLFGSQST
jgi:hypothetical protein